MSNPFNLDAPAVKRMLADAHGPQAAAWMLRPRRKSLHVLGCVDFELPFGNKPPRWLQYAVIALKKRTRFWRVKTFTTTKGTVWRVMWLGGKQRDWRKTAS